MVTKKKTAKLSSKSALEAVVTAWESLGGGQHHSIHDVQKWLINDMKPAIDKARKVLKRKY